MIREHNQRSISNTILRFLKGRTRFEKTTDRKSKSLGLSHQGLLKSDRMTVRVLLRGTQAHHTAREDYRLEIRIHMLAQLQASSNQAKIRLLDLGSMIDKLGQDLSREDISLTQDTNLISLQ